MTYSTDENANTTHGIIAPAREVLDLTGCHPEFAAGVRRIVELHKLKGADYGRPEDMFANVKGSEEWGVPAWVGAMVRATDKVRRLQTLARGQELQNESALDSFEDLANYALIARALFVEAQG